MIITNADESLIYLLCIVLTLFLDRTTLPLHGLLQATLACEYGCQCEQRSSQMPALGRHFVLGDLYDSRTDKIVPSLLHFICPIFTTFKKLINFIFFFTRRQRIVGLYKRFTSHLAPVQLHNIRSGRFG